ncbi:Quinidine resistance protein 1 [Leucoagaricus sp. SymC.cos]|nr:Quinidine resistance protein 1 [Leucoagaricus sp. SymC.cos]
MSDRHSLEKSRATSPSQSRPPPETNLANSDAPVDLRSTLSKKEKWFIVILIALAAFFGPFTQNIYYPAIPTLARAFEKSIELINLTVTVYTVIQATSPMLWGPLSDNLGRRPIAAACLLVLAASCVGLALVPTSMYWLLMVLRCVQSVGSGSIIAIGAGVISDISTPAERGGFYGVFALGPMVALGPVVGGALTQGLGWRSIFWFLVIAVSLCLVVLILFLPETLPSRQQAQSGFKVIYNPIISIIGREVARRQSSLPQAGTAIAAAKKFENPFQLFLKPNILFLLALNATSYAVFFAVVTSLSALFEEAYPFLDEFRIGLCFLSIGGAMAGGTGIVGKVLDWLYQAEKKRLHRRLEDAGELEKRLQEANVKAVDKLLEFPLERLTFPSLINTIARLSPLPVMVIILAGCTAGYGWSLQGKANLAVPLILQAIIGFIVMSVMNGTMTLMIDLTPGRGSAVQACGNLVRSSLVAVIISIIQPIINGIGVGWTFVLLAGFLLTAMPCFYFILKFGPRWRVVELASKLEAQATVHDAQPTTAPLSIPEKGGSSGPVKTEE